MNYRIQLFEKKDKIICIMILLCMIFGPIFTSGNYNIGGLILTLYRVGIPLIALYYFITRCKEKIFLKYFTTKIYLVYIIIFMFWILYGLILIYISQYSVLYDGIKEIMTLFLGMLSVYCITECCKDKEMFYYFFQILKIFVSVLCLFGLFEMLLDVHFPVSRYAYDYRFDQVGHIFELKLTSGKLYPVTTIFYGANDFSAFLAIFMPLFFLDKEISKKEKKKNILMISIISFILSINDANICLVSIAIAMIFMIILRRKVDRYLFGNLMVVFVMQQWIAKWIGKGIALLEKNIAKLYQEDKVMISEETSNKITSVIEEITSQVQNAEVCNGSLYVRIMLALDSLEMWIKSKFLGVGPDGFAQCLRLNGGRTHLVNPHNFWLEILSQYGFIVFIAYVGLLLYIFIKNIKNYMITKDLALVKYICILVVYVFASIAPSSFLDYSYQWIVLGLGLSAVKIFSSSS